MAILNDGHSNYVIDLINMIKPDMGFFYIRKEIVG
jgi:hypothetical protein